MSTPTPPLPDHEREEWRDFLLQELVTYLGAHKEEIIGRYLDQSRGRLSRDQIEAQGLLDFDISITLHRRSAINLRTRSGLFQDQPDPLRRLAFRWYVQPVTAGNGHPADHHHRHTVHRLRCRVRGSGSDLGEVTPIRRRSVLDPLCRLDLHGGEPERTAADLLAGDRSRNG